MMVVKVFMWPGGDENQERLLSVMTLSLKGELERTGERRYEVRVFKDAQFLEDPSVLEDAVELRKGRRENRWKQDAVRGHFPGPRGVWDLIGGALKVTLGNRLGRYRRSALSSKPLPQRKPPGGPRGE